MLAGRAPGMAPSLLCFPRRWAWCLRGLRTASLRSTFSASGWGAAAASILRCVSRIRRAQRTHQRPARETETRLRNFILRLVGCLDCWLNDCCYCSVLIMIASQDLLYSTKLSKQQLSDPIPCIQFIVAAGHDWSGILRRPLAGKPKAIRIPGPRFKSQRSTA